MTETEYSELLDTALEQLPTDVVQRATDYDLLAAVDCYLVHVRIMMLGGRPGKDAPANWPFGKTSWQASTQPATTLVAIAAALAREVLRRRKSSKGDRP